MVMRFRRIGKTVVWIYRASPPELALLARHSVAHSLNLFMAIGPTSCTFITYGKLYSMSLKHDQ